MPAASTLAAALADRYRIERELGAGGMATVYLAHDLKHDRDVAIKVLHQDLAAALGAERFLAEIKVTARLQHPHILPLLDSGESAGLLYYVMPFVAGESLRDRLNREKQLPIDDAVRIAREVADALGHAHGHDVIHRDIKPENILLQEGHALVADFGIALAVQSAGGQRMTQTGLSLGTPQYMSPEQAMGEKAIDARADIYALGAVTYEMLTGEPPFTGATVQAIVAKVMSERPARPTMVRDTVPTHVELAVLKALAKLPADRWGSAALMGDALAQDRETSARDVKGAAQAPRRASLVAAIGALAVAVAALAWVIAGAPTRAGTTPDVALSITLPDSLQLTFDGVARSIDISRDGRTVVFVATSGQLSRAFYRDLRDTALHLIPGSDNARGLLFSPDGQSIAAYIQPPGGTLEVRRLALDGRANLKLADNPNWDASWQATDRLVTTGRDGMEILSVSTVAKPGVKIRLPRPVSAIAPQDLPGGKWILAHFWMPHRQGSFASIGVVAAASGEPFVLTRHGPVRPGSASAEETLIGRAPRYLKPGYLSYTRFDGTIMLVKFDLRNMRIVGEARPVLSGVQLEPYYAVAQYGVAENGTLAYAEGASGTIGSFAWVDHTGRADSLPFAPGTYSFISLSRDGRRIAASVARDGPNELWTFDLSVGGTAARVPEDAPWWGAAWWPDGQSFVHGTTTGWLKRRSVRDHRVLDSLKTDGLEFLVDVSPDGKTILVSRRAEVVSPGLFLVSWPDGRRTTISTDTTAAFGAFSPDGKWILYGRSDGGQSDYAMYLAPLSNPARQLRIRAGYTPIWSRDGTKIYYGGDGWRVYSITRHGDAFGEPSVAYEGHFLVGGNVINVGPDGRLLLALPKKQPPVRQIRIVTNWLARAAAQLPR